jgi:hypothetical protein
MSTKRTAVRESMFICSACDARGPVIHLETDPCPRGSIWLCHPCARAVSKAVTTPKRSTERP